MNLAKLTLILRYGAMFCKGTNVDVITRAKIVQAAMEYANEFNYPESLSPETVKLIQDKFSTSAIPKATRIVVPK